MAVEVLTKILSRLTGSDKDLFFPEVSAVTATVTKGTINKQIQATTNTAEALNLCGITTVELIIIKATSKKLLIDTSYVAPDFNTEIKVPEGEVAVFKPGGAVYIKNETAGEVCTVNYLVVGSA